MLFICLTMSAAGCGGAKNPNAPDRLTIHAATPDAGSAGQTSGRPPAADDPTTGPTAPPGHPEKDPGPAVSEAECQALLDHFLALARAAHASTVAPELVPTDEQLAAIRQDLAPQFLLACARLDRKTYACELAARTQEALLACSATPAP